MTYYLWRMTPDDKWMVYNTARDPMPEPDEIASWEQVRALPVCQFYAEAQAEADRLNGKRQEGEQRSLEI